MDLLYRRAGMPEEGELVMCEVTNVYKNGVFIKLIEYDKQGFIHISEVSPGRIRNLNDYVKVGKVIICKILKIDRNRGHIDLTLRRVTESQRRLKAEEIKQEQKAEKIIELAAKGLNLKKQELYNTVSEKVLEKHPYIHMGFNEYLENKKFLDKYKFEKKVHDKLMELIAQRIKPPIVELMGDIAITSYAPNGVTLIKDALISSQEKFKQVGVSYGGSGKFNMKTTSSNYKKASGILQEFAELVIATISKADKTAVTGFTIKDAK